MVAVNYTDGEQQSSAEQVVEVQRVLHQVLVLKE
jgi:hypothetical protein